ncbi:hypothetical protein ACCO45_004200 [Purpureocillium lilacinum]|uniref:Uncharacterized protein n=1 Tax=Purpureocillium lilacinum TaxID=33203 RepID=A0ACC4E247_PURLI
MAEASCSGPSPFKRLVDHQSRDVSHHQDRLVDRAGVNGHAPSTPRATGPRFVRRVPQRRALRTPAGAMIPGMPHSPAGRLNAHAAALQQPMPQHMQHEFAQQQHQARASPAPDLTSWAADFSRFTAGNNQHQQPQMRGGAAPMQMQMAQPNFQGAFGQAFSPMFGQQGPQFMQPGAAAAAAAPVAESDFDQEMARWMASNGGGT